MSGEPPVLRCNEPDCGWHVEQPIGADEVEVLFNLDALTGHQRRVHIKQAYRGSDKLDDVMSIECPFKEEPMRAAFYVGWLAARR